MNKTSSSPKQSKISIESALFQISNSAIDTATMEDYYAQLHSIIKQLMYAENFYVVLNDQSRKLVSLVYSVDTFDHSLDVEKLKDIDAEYLKLTLTGYLLKTGKMVHLNYQQIKSMEEQGILSSVGAACQDWLGVPLYYKDELLGAIIIQSYIQGISYGKQEEDILQFVARQIALVFKSKQFELTLKKANLTLEIRVSERTHELKKINSELSQEIEERKKSEQIQLALFEISDLISSSKNLDDLYFGVHQIIKKLMYAENEYIALMLPESNTIEFPYFVDRYDPIPGNRKLRENFKDASMTEKVISSGSPLLYVRSVNDSDAHMGRNSASWLGVPLKDKDKTFGILAVQSYDKKFVYSNKHKAILQTVGQQVATAILRKKDADALLLAHANLEHRVKMRTVELEDTIKKRKKIEDKLEHDSLHDNLTGLPNRLFMYRELERLIFSGPSNKSTIAVLFLDLDRFKIINDSLGHRIGDLVLIEVSKRLKKCLRTGDFVARLGGDEFCLLMPNIDNKQSAIHLCERILIELNHPIEIEVHSLITSASIGIRFAVAGQSTTEEIMSDADAAMYQAKHQGKNRYCIFDAEIKEIVTNRMKIETELCEAVENNKLELYYQPIIDIKNAKIAGFEALIRWKHPLRGFISPVEFIPIAEETGLILHLGNDVIKMACDALSRFSKHPSLSQLYININISAVQILAHTLNNTLMRNMGYYGVDPSKLNIEITESILIEDYKVALKFVQDLKVMGIKTYLDDFGTGYSSLSYLHKFSFDVIKLDRSFIQELSKGQSNLTIVESIGALAKNLGMDIVAEGIETKQQLQSILELGYTNAQGFLFSKPIPLEEVFKLVENPDFSKHFNF